MIISIIDAFLENSFLPIYGITVISALWRYSRYFDTPLKFFPILVMYTLLNELFGMMILNNDQISVVFTDLYINNNWLLFNIYNSVFFLYFYYVYWYYCPNRRHRMAIVFGSILFVLVSIINPFYQNFLVTSQIYSYTAGGIVLLMCIVLYGKHLKRSLNTYFNSRDLISWLSLGMFVFYVGYVPIKISRFYNAMYGFNDHPLVRRTHLILILFMYVCFILGFVKMRRLKK